MFKGSNLLISTHHSYNLIHKDSISFHVIDSQLIFFNTTNNTFLRDLINSIFSQLLFILISSGSKEKILSNVICIFCKIFSIFCKKVFSGFTLTNSHALLKDNHFSLVVIFKITKNINILYIT
jgi:hypothetical protein